jgi:alkylation response protein AidB-like acyl-CoA dehydrogenase
MVDPVQLTERARRIADEALRERYLPDLVSGRRRAGIALAGVRPGPDQVRVVDRSDGWLLNGTAPWVTGWDLIDTVQVAAVDLAQLIHFFLVDAVAGPTLTVSRPDLTAAQASSTGQLEFHDHLVDAARLVTTVPMDEWLAANASGSAFNGFSPSTWPVDASA